MKYIFTFLFLSSAVISCTTALRANYNSDPAADFSDYHTFYWDQPLNKAVNESFNPIVNNTLVNKQITQVITNEMENRGYRLDSVAADLLINFHVMVENKSKVRSTYPDNYYFWWRNDVQTINYKEGTLVIDLLDANSDQLVWQGYSSGNINRENIVPTLKEAVQEVFTHYEYRVGDAGQTVASAVSSVTNTRLEND